MNSRIPTAQNVNHFPISPIMLTAWPERIASTAIEDTGKIKSSRATVMKYMRFYKFTLA